MTAWAVEILHDPATFPMSATTLKVFVGIPVLARVEWNPPNPTAATVASRTSVHRGVTLYAGSGDGQADA